MIRLGLVGCGAWGRNYIKTIESVPSAELVAICDKTGPITDYREIISKIDKVIIATPPSTHWEIATHFLEAGIPVLLEKPVAETLGDAEAIFNTAQRQNTTILIDNTHLFSPAYVALRSMVSNWEHPFNIESFGLNHGPFREYSSLLDYGPHDLSMCFGVTKNYPNSIKITKEEKNPGEIYILELDFVGIHATIKVGNGHNCKERKFSVIGSDGYIMYDGLIPSLKLNNSIEFSSPLPLSEVIHSFVNNTIDWRYDPEFNLNIMKILTDIK